MSQGASAVLSDAADHSIDTGVLAHDKVQMHDADDQVREANPVATQATNRASLNLESSRPHQAVGPSNEINSILPSHNQQSSQDVASQNQTEPCVTKAAHDPAKILDNGVVKEENDLDQGKTPDNSLTKERELEQWHITSTQNQR